MCSYRKSLHNVFAGSEQSLEAQHVVISLVAAAAVRAKDGALKADELRGATVVRAMYPLP
jgi:hypothetical protein